MDSTSEPAEPDLPAGLTCRKSGLVATGVLLVGVVGVIFPPELLVGVAVDTRSSCSSMGGGGGDIVTWGGV